MKCTFKCKRLWNSCEFHTEFKLLGIVIKCASLWLHVFSRHYWNEVKTPEHHLPDSSVRGQRLWQRHFLLDFPCVDFLLALYAGCISKQSSCKHWLHLSTKWLSSRWGGRSAPGAVVRGLPRHQIQAGVSWSRFLWRPWSVFHASNSSWSNMFVFVPWIGCKRKEVISPSWKILLYTRTISSLYIIEK